LFGSDVGDAVKPETVLALLDDTDYQLAKQSAEAEIERINALLKAQQLSVTRLKGLLAKRSTNQAKLDEAQAQFGALVAQKKAAQVRRQQALRQSKLISPNVSFQKVISLPQECLFLSWSIMLNYKHKFRCQVVYCHN